MIRVHYKNAAAEVVGGRHGLSKAERDGALAMAAAAHAAVVSQWNAGQLGYTALPTRTDYRRDVARLVDKHAPHTSDLVVLGIGGSALGNIALQTALNPVTYNLMPPDERRGPRLFVLDNVDPALLGDVLCLLGDRLETTLFNVISKSGETAETASQFMVVRRVLRDALGEKFAGRIVATTDTQKGTLHQIAREEGYDMLAVPGDVGGRFSVLSPVGLFSAALCGIDIDALLAGAAAMAERVKTAHAHANPACVLAAVHYAMMTAKGKPIHVMMPYSNRLFGLADWFRQLWAESLGKQVDRDGKEVFAGSTPVKALGATDQHSQVQLYREGPNDKLMVFLTAGKHPAEVEIPKDFRDVGGLGYLGGVSVADLLAAEKTATEYALAKSNRPSVTIALDEISAGDVGEFIFLYEFVTSLVGEMLNINAYDQPAVELGKQATFALLGRAGYEDLAREIRSFAREDKAFVV